MLVIYVSETRFNIELNDAERGKISALATEVNRSRSELIREWLTLGIQLYAGLIVPETDRDADQT